jgi:hypothetical protein
MFNFEGSGEYMWFVVRDFLNFQHSRLPRVVEFLIWNKNLPDFVELLFPL